MKYKFSELVDMNKLQKIMESFYSMTGINCSIKNKKNRLITENKSNNGCINCNKTIFITDFGGCEAENNILSQIDNGKNYAVYKCKNGLVYLGAPIIINGEYIATMFAGQIFLKKPDIEYFKNQASELNLDEDEYIEAVNKVPVVLKEEIRKTIDFLCNCTEMLGELGYRQLKELEINKKLNENYIELFGAYEQLRASEQGLRNQYEEVERMAYYDLVTNLPNLNLFRKDLESRINSNEKFAIFLVELDNFKNVNDTFGSEYGDKLLREMGKVIRIKLEKSLIVARNNGDSFLVLQSHIIEKKEAVETAEKILKILNGLWQIDEKEFFISSSIGITIYPDDGENSTRILGNADIAVNKIKGDVKNSYKFFENSMYDEILKKAEMEKELRKAVKCQEFTLHYQPQVHVETRKIVSFEALIRWNNKKLGWVSPKDFISLAEETGLIVPVGEWVLRTACIQNNEWKNKGYLYNFISVNVSAIQLQKSDFVNVVKNILEETNTEPQCLEIEITESVMMESLELNLNVLNELKSMGVRVALDDFGTGYSSLNYLKSLPINTLKIDKTFIDGLCKSSYEEIITEQIINLAHKMELEVVAEGVELEEQLKSLEGKNCNKIQGYYFSKPLPPEEITSFFENSIIGYDNDKQW